MEKRERLEKTISGDATDRAPVALWRHLPGDDQRAADFARYTVGFQRAYDWDFILVTPFSAYGVVDYGAFTVWAGAIDGDREVSKPAVSRSLDWTNLRVLDPRRGELGRHIESLHLIDSALGEMAASTPVLTTIYSPLDQAMMLAGQAQTLHHLRTEPDRLQSGLNTLTETTLRFIESLRRAPVDGICYVMSSASYALMSRAEYAAEIQPYDDKVLAERPRDWWLTLASLPGPLPMLDLAATYPVQALHFDFAGVDLARLRVSFPGALCGGLTRPAHLDVDTPNVTTDAVRTALLEMNHRRLIVSADGPASLLTPRSNLRAVRDAVH